jgi:NAD(P)-dependent dehydrogenase (short-subunit alcohol dehydrogenase family)
MAFATTTSSNEINAIIIGGSSGMGKAAAVQTVKNGGNALLVSRSADKLQQAKEHIQAASGCNIERIRTKVLDASDEAAVQAFANELSSDDWEFDALIVSAAGKAPHGPMTEIPTSDTRSMMESKFWTAYNAAKYINPKLKEGGSITFVS